MPISDLQRITGFLAAFARRQATRVRDLPGGFAAYDDAFAHSRANNQIVVDGTADGRALPALAEELLGHLPQRLVFVLDDATGTACAEQLTRAGYTWSRYLVMLHTGPVPSGGQAREASLDDLRAPVARSWRTLLPHAGDEALRQLVERREARRRGADIVRFLAARAADGEVASWCDLYADPATGTAQIEDLVTSEAHLRRGHGDAVLATAVRMAAEEGCGTRFLIAAAEDWPRHWYERRGFAALARVHGFERG